MSRFAFVFALFGAVALAAPASATTFYFIRHAESTANAGTATTHEEMVDPPLTDLGQEQAVTLADLLSGIDLTAIYVSAYQRTALTIAPTAAEFGLTPTVVAAINEWSFGSTDLTDYTPMYAMIAAWLAGDTSVGIEGVDDSESLDDLVARVLPGYLEILSRYAGSDADDVVAIVGHGGSIAWVLPYLVENLSLDYALTNGMNNTGIIEVEAYQGKYYVTNYLGTIFDWPGANVPAVPLPASGLMLLGAAGAVAAGGLRKKRAKAAMTSAA